MTDREGMRQEVRSIIAAEDYELTLPPDVIDKVVGELAEYVHKRFSPRAYNPPPAALKDELLSRLSSALGSGTVVTFKSVFAHFIANFIESHYDRNEA